MARLNIRFVSCTLGAAALSVSVLSLTSLSAQAQSVEDWEIEEDEGTSSWEDEDSSDWEEDEDSSDWEDEESDSDFEDEDEEEDEEEVGNYYEVYCSPTDAWTEWTVTDWEKKSKKEDGTAKGRGRGYFQLDLGECEFFYDLDEGGPTAKYECYCAYPDEDEVVSGEIAISNDGENIDKELTVGLCKEKLNAHCGPFKLPQKASCHNDYGQCEIGAQGKLGESPLLEAFGECECINGTSWEYAAFAPQELALDSAGLREICKNEVNRCLSPDNSKGHASGSGLSSHIAAEVSCGTAYGECGFVSESYDGDIYSGFECGCVDGRGESLEGHENWSSKSLEDLAGQCFDWVRACHPNSPNPHPYEDGASSPQNEGDAPVAVEERDGLADADGNVKVEPKGCQIGGGSPEFGYLAFLGLAGLAWRRRR